MNIKADLHLHSKYSDYPSTLLLKAYNSPESFTEPETIYQQAKSHSMDLVTITDHDDIRGCLELVNNHPKDCFISCEVTAYFPEDECKVHILVYGIDQQEYDHIMAIRRNLFVLRDFIIENKIAYSVAHASHDQDGKLRFEHIEKLVLLFDVFETVNGGSAELSNTLLQQYLDDLDREKIKALQNKHAITPASNMPWVKGYTGGSDDHCGLLIGTAYTHASLSQPQNHIESFLNSIRNKATQAQGMHGSFEIYATGVFKHIHDYRLARDKKYHKTKMNDFLEMFFVGNEGNWAKRFKKSQSLRFLKHKNTKTHRALHTLLKKISDETEQDIANKIPSTFDNIASLHDEMFRSVISAFTKHLPNGDIFKVFNHFATLLPMTLLATPFVGSMRHQALKSEIKEGLTNISGQDHKQKALWFTDTIDDLNGVSVTLRQIASYGEKHNYRLSIVTCVDETAINTPLPNNSINFTPVSLFTVPGYETQDIGFPSMLSMMKRIVKEQPDQIIVSTPGPLGLGAIVCAKLMDLPIKMIYHTDFSEQLLRMNNEVSVANITDHIVNAIYKQADQVFVPSQAYIDKLSQAGLEPTKLSIFPRGLDFDLYRPKASLTAQEDKKDDLFTLIFAGRISEDKNLSLLSKIFNTLEEQTPGLYKLVIAGNGPDLASLTSKLNHHKNVTFTGRIDASKLVEHYQESDLLVFPSHTDTFGMVVLEAQACGIPALVTPSGGPKEIIINNETGKVVENDLIETWVSMINDYRTLKQNSPENYREIRSHCVAHVHQKKNWQDVFDQVVGQQCKGTSNGHLLPKINTTNIAA